MKFLSTRGAPATGLDEALVAGLAPDGGLFVPESLPAFDVTDFDGLERIDAIGERLLAPFFDGSVLAPELGAICRETFDFPLPLVPLAPEDGGRLSVLELFHGPTAAFKDVGARFLAGCMQRLPLTREDPRPLTILVATSGDTGGAVAAAFHRRPGIQVVVLYPDGQVSPRQAHQLACWGDNVLTLAVKGPFDACQRLVKGAFADGQLLRTHRLCSANSINIGRLLPQAVYYAASSLWHLREHGEAPSYVIPTGNLGNGHASVLARAMGLPIRDIVFATNENRAVPEFLRTGEHLARDSVSTLASAMDVGDPSNLERLRHLYPGIEQLRERVEAHAVSDDQIRAQIVTDSLRRGQVWCPHTATAAHVYDRLDAARRRGRGWVLVATAHPAKFDTVVEPLLGHTVDVPAPLQALLERPARYTEIDASAERLREIIQAFSEG